MELMHEEKLEYRRLRDNRNKRKLNKDEVKRLNEFKASFKLGWKDQKGYDFEMELLRSLKDAGLGEFIVYHNPVEPYEWAHTKTVGVDFQLKIGKFRFYVEASYCDTPYHYRRRWFTKCRVARFRDCPKPDSTTSWVLVTNRPENFNSVSDLSQEYSITILPIQQLITLITTITNNETDTNRQTIHEYEYVYI